MTAAFQFTSAGELRSLVHTNLEHCTKPHGQQIGLMSLLQTGNQVGIRLYVRSPHYVPTTILSTKETGKQTKKTLDLIEHICSSREVRQKNDHLKQ